MKCRFANARPEPDFRYFSKTAALDSDANSMEATSPHGLRAAVCWDPPLLWVTSRLRTSEVRPT